MVHRVRAWASSVHDGQLRAASAVLPHTGRERARYTSGHGARARMAARLGVEGCDALDVVGAIPNPNPNANPSPNPSPSPSPNPNLGVEGRDVLDVVGERRRLRRARLGRLGRPGEGEGEGESEGEVRVSLDLAAGEAQARHVWQGPAVAPPQLPRLSCPDQAARARVRVRVGVGVGVRVRPRPLGGGLGGGLQGRMAGRRAAREGGWEECWGESRAERPAPGGVAASCASRAVAAAAELWRPRGGRPWQTLPRYMCISTCRGASWWSCRPRPQPSFELGVGSGLGLGSGSGLRFVFVFVFGLGFALEHLGLPKG